MSKDSILDYSTVPSENQDIGGISVLGTAKPSNLDDGYRMGMSHIAKGLVARRVAKDTAYTAVKADHNQVIDFTETATCTTSSAASLTDGWLCYLYASGGDVTINPNGSETVNGEEFIIIREGTFGALRVYDGNFLFNGFTTGSTERVCFYAMKTANQSISTAGVLVFNDEKVDIGSYYDPATYRWTPPAGFYEVTLSCQLQTSSSPSGLGPNGEVYYGSTSYAGTVAIRKNGTIIASARAEIWSNPSEYAHASVTAILEMNGTDYVDAYGSGTSVSVFASIPGGWNGASTFSGRAI